MYKRQDLGTGKAQSVRITSNSGLTEVEIKRMIDEAEKSKDEDAKKKLMADVRNNAEGLIYTTEKSLEEYGHVLTPQDVEDIKADLENLKRQLEINDYDAIKEALTRLEGSSHRIAEAMYAEAAKEG